MKKIELTVGQVYHANWLPKTPTVTLICMEGSSRARVIPFTQYSQHEGQAVHAIVLNPSRLRPLKPGEEVRLPVSR